MTSLKKPPVKTAGDNSQLLVKFRPSKLLAFFSPLLLVGCLASNPIMGGSSGNTVTGSAAGGSSQGNNSELESCDESLGTLGLFENTSQPWWRDYRRRYPDLGSTTPVIRLMIQQSNCFVIVERGRAMDAMNRERQLMQSGQLRSGSNIGGGQMVAADYTLSPEVHFSAKGTKGLQAVGGALLGSIGALVGGGMKKNEASTTLLLIENRSGVQVSSSIGSAGNYDYNVLGGMFAGFAGGGARAFTDTPEGKVITAAFADSYNQMVKALRNYKAQTVKGGLGKGGRLKVGGDDDPMPEATDSSIVPVAPQATKTAYVSPDSSSSTISRKKNYNFEVEDYDEDALKDYYNSLKNASTWASSLAALSASQVDDKTRNQFRAVVNMFSGQLESNRIELESWPLDAKQEAWKVMGKRIEKHNKLFDKHRKVALNNEALDAGTRSLLESIELITEESLLSE